MQDHLRASSESVGALISKMSMTTPKGLLLVLIASLLGPVESVQVEIQQNGDGSSINQHSEANIAFDLPDLTASLETATGDIQIEAYKSVNNDAILSDTTGNRISQLYWVSIGHPGFVKTKDQTSGKDFSLFHFTTTGFTTYVEMMTKTHRQTLTSTAISKYKVDVVESQVVNLILSSFKCTLRLYDDNGKKYLLNGEVSNFRQFPLRMDFEVPTRSVERKLFLEIISQSEADLKFDCKLESSGGKLMKTNTLTINAHQMQQIELEEKLFGPAGSNGQNEAYVTRDQMTELASEMYSTLNIIEDYQMPEHQFSEGFVDGLISQLASTQFAQVPIDSVLESLSKYGFDIGADIQPDVIKRDAGSILKVEESNSKKRIIVDETKYRELTESESSSSGRAFKVLGFDRSVERARSSSQSDVSEEQSLRDQLDELNTASRDEVQWEIEGNRVIPKSLNVARVMRSKMTKTLTFNRIRIQSFSAPFDRKFAIYSRLSNASDWHFNQLSTRVADLENLQTSIRSAQTQLAASVSAVSTNAIRRCRICFQETQGTSGCQGSRNSCSGWSNLPSSDWTAPFVDFTSTRSGSCVYRWKVECLPD